MKHSIITNFNQIKNQIFSIFINLKYNYPILHKKFNYSKFYSINNLIIPLIIPQSTSKNS